MDLTKIAVLSILEIEKEVKYYINVWQKGQHVKKIGNFNLSQWKKINLNKYIDLQSICKNLYKAESIESTSDGSKIILGGMSKSGEGSIYALTFDSNLRVLSFITIQTEPG
jgi:hypothetical protein